MSATASSDRDAFGLCGTVLGDKYRVLEVVGEGGFGVVYRGVHAGFDAPIALKCLKVPPHFDRRAEQALVEGLRTEGRLLLRLSQRTSGIVQALDVGSFETARGARVPYLVLEWLDGRSLADELRLRRKSGRGGMGLGEALGVLEPAARALAVAHGEKIAHRDVKPENLFLVETAGGPTVKVLDFGIAKVLAEAATPETAATSGGAPTFTPPYAAPEQFDRRRGASGPWTDVFALALVFVELVAGRRALVGETLIDFLRASCDEDRRPTLRACGVEAPDAVERVLARALAVDPSARYPTAGAFWDALAAAIGSLDGATVSRAGAAPATDSAGADAGVSTAEYASAVGIAVDGGASPRVDSTAAHARTAVAPEPLDSAAAATRAPTTRAGVVVEEPSAGRRRAPLVAAGAVAAVLAVGLVVYLARGPREPDATLPSASGTESAPSASAAPVSAIPEAAALYGEALEAWRGGSPEAAVRAMERAAALDRDLGAAQLRLALWKFGRKPVDARDHYDLALRHAASLGPKEAALLAAVEPMLREPSDFEALDARLGKLCEDHPGDGELWGYLAAARLKRLRFDDALAAVEPALAADPGNVGAWVLKAESLSMKGDSAGQLAAYEACLARVPRAVECLNKLIGVRSTLGDCAGMRDGARRLLAMNPRSATTQRQLALSLFAAGEPHDAVLQALGQSWELRAESD
ncbi:MAG: protein kinase, partial [Polyangiaceae bacterium]|nr:protein kinase [Polyangiaceae bacterium]